MVHLAPFPPPGVDAPAFRVKTYYFTFLEIFIENNENEHFIFREFSRKITKYNYGIIQAPVKG